MVDAAFETTTNIPSTESLLNALVEASRHLLAADWQTGLKEALAALGRLAGLDRVYVIHHDSTGSGGILIAEHCTSSVASVNECLKAGRCLIAEDAEVWKSLMAGEACSSPLSGIAGAAGGGSTLFVPIFVKGLFWGAIGFDDCRRERFFTGAEQAVLRGLAAAISAAICRHESELRRLVEEQHLQQLLKGVVDASKALLEETELKAGIERWMSALGSALEADCAVMGAFGKPESESIVALGQLTWTRPGLPAPVNVEIPPTTDFISWREKLLAGETLWIDFDDLRDPASQTFWEINGSQTMVLVPVMVDQVILGWLCFEWRRHFDWKDSFTPLLRTAADGAASAIRRLDAARAAEMVRDQAALERTERIAAHNAVLRRSASRLSASADFNDVFATSLAEVALTLNANSAHLFFYEPEQHTLSLGVAWREGVVSTLADPEEPEIFAQAIQADITPGFARLCSSRRFLSLSKGELDGLEWPGVVEWFRRSGYRQAIVLALMVGDRPLGVLGLVFRAAAELNEQQGELLYALAAQMALGLEFKRLAALSQRAAIDRELEAAEEKREAELARTNEALRRSTERLAKESDLHPFLGALMSEATSVSGAKSAGVFSYDSVLGIFKMESFMTQGKSVSIEEDPRMEIWRQPMPSHITEPWVRQLQEKGIGIITIDPDDPEHEYHPWSISVAWHKNMGHRQIITVPLYAGGQMIGTLGQCFTDPVAMESFDYEQVRLLATPVAVALQLARLADKARIAATEIAVFQERNRIARDLHDTLAQGFTGVLAQLGAAEGAVELNQGSQVLHYLERAKSLARFSLAEARSSVHALRPEIHGESLEQRLRAMVVTMTAGTALEARVEERGKSLLLSPGVDWCVHKFVQEALTNAFKHSKAHVFTLELAWHEDGLRVIVTDDGQGFDPQLAHRGIGLAMMHERAAENGGRILHASPPQGGTCLTLELPLNPSRLKP